MIENNHIPNWQKLIEANMIILWVNSHCRNLVSLTSHAKNVNFKSLPDLAASSVEVNILCILEYNLTLCSSEKSCNSYWWFEGTAGPFLYCLYFFFLVLIFDSQNTFNCIFAPHNFSYFFDHFFFIFPLTWSPYFFLNLPVIGVFLFLYLLPQPLLI